mgnify:CR=1 FL=1
MKKLNILWIGLISVLMTACYDDYEKDYDKSTVISSLGNVGPGLGAFGPAFSWAALPDAAKWVLSFLMLIGRLELFAVLLLFYSGFWER